jgi:hypothetical protein
MPAAEIGDLKKKVQNAAIPRDELPSVDTDDTDVRG